MQRVPFSFKEQSEFMLASWGSSSARRQDECAIQFFEQLRWCETIQIFQHAVVRKNLHLVVRKNHRQKKSALAGAFACLINASGCRASVMPIRNIETGHLAKLF